MNTPIPPIGQTPEITDVPKQNRTATKPQATPEPWEEFLEDEGDCCGGCNHKPR